MKADEESFERRLNDLPVGYGCDCHFRLEARTGIVGWTTARRFRSFGFSYSATAGRRTVTADIM
jgi:hypothetical protein